MTTKSILLAVADPQALVDITQALGDGWEPISVACEADALAQLEQRSFDALLVDFDLGSPDASELLNQALEKRPEIARFLFAYEKDLALVAAKVLGAYQILPKPIEPGSLLSRIENGVSSSESEQTQSEPTDAITASPTIPSVYAEALKALESPDVTNEELADIIAKDETLTSELLRLTNSTYLGLPRNLTEPVEAVDALGLETVKAVVMALQFLAEHSRLNSGYLSLDHIWQHSVNVGQIARDLVLFETKDRKLASQALTAGLLHDLGKIVLATNFDDLYGRVHSLARKQPVTLWDVEKEMFGANHGEIGACLLGMWNMPSAIVEAAALHHEPPLGEQQQLTPLAAVHIANVLEHQLHPSDDDMLVAPIVNTPFLNELGLLQRLPIWRAAFANRGCADLQEEVEALDPDLSEATVVASKPTLRTTNQLPAPAAATRTTTSGQPSPANGIPEDKAARSRRGWAYAGVVGVLALLALWLRTQPDPEQTEPVYARTPAYHHAPATAAPLAAENSAAAAQVAPGAVVSEQRPTPPAPAPDVSSTVVSTPAATPATATPAPEITAVASSQTIVTNLPTPSPAPKEKALREFRLNGIIYMSARPAAIVNGQTVSIGDEVDGATVVGIERTAVTLRIDGKRKILPLR